MNKNNYALSSIDLIKIIGIVNMISIHCLIFINRATSTPVDPVNAGVLKKFFIFHCFNTISLPITAGFLLYAALEKYLDAGKIKNVPTQRFFYAWIILAVIESFKNTITFNLSYFFRWDVLHFIALSFFIIYFICSFFSIKTLGRFFFIVFISSFFPVFQHLSFGRYLFFVNDRINLNTMTFDSVIIALCFSLLIFFGLKSLLKKYSKFKFMSYLFSAIVFIGIMNKTQSNNLFYAQLHNLPLSIFYQQGQIGGHIWPLYPWITLVLFGFLFNYYYQQSSKTNSLNIKLLVTSSFSLLVFLPLFSHQILEHFSKKYTFSSSFFKPDGTILFISFLLFTALFSLFNLILKKYPWKSKTLSEISDGTLIIYVLHIFVGWKTVRIALQIFDQKYIYAIYPLLILFLTYCYFEGINFLIQKKIFIRLKRDPNAANS